MKQQTFVLLFGLFLSGPALAQPIPVSLDAPLPIDPPVRIDTLNNGLVYYIRNNMEPAHRAELRLVVKAGSILEDDDQTGLAHFVEHMLFNGTQHFQEQALIDFFEHAGMQFGPDVNAYTSFDETVYMLEVPTDSVNIMEKGFEVLRDWASYATLADESIDQERGIVVEEWRVGRGASGRIRDQILPVLLAESRYKDRLPIGDTLTLRQAPPEALRRFYSDWYRTDLMAVIAVGDFDVNTIEKRIIHHFADLPAQDDPRPRATFGVPEQNQPRYKIATDPELPYTQLQIYFSQPANVTKTARDFRSKFIARLLRTILNNRFSEIARDGTNSPFLWASISRGSIVKPSAYYSLAAQVEEDSIFTGLAALITEASRVQQHGITTTELDREKVRTLRSYESSFRDQENRHSGTYAGEYIRHFLKGEPILSVEYLYTLVKHLLPEITLEEINAHAAELFTEHNRSLILTMPEKEGLLPPSENELMRVMTEAAKQPVAAYVDNVTDKPLMAIIPEPVDIVREQEKPEMGVTEITLANGIRVIMKPTDFREEEVLFSASSPGGSSLVDDDDHFVATVADILISKSGVGDFDRTVLNKKLSGKFASVSPYISELEEGLSGQASPDDLETLFQLIYLYVTAPRADSAALLSFQNQQRSLLINRAATPMSAFQDSLAAAFYGDWPRGQPPTVAQIDSLDIQKALSIYKDRFADTSDFTFVFVGNFDPDTLRTLATRYLGTLPVTEREESWRDLGPDPPHGSVVKVARKGQDPQSQIGIIFHGPVEYDREHRHRLRSLEAVLNIRLREELREERAGIYSAFVQSSASNKPDSTYVFSVFFGCDPQRADEMTQAVFEEIEAIKTDADIADTVAKVQQQQRRERELSLEENSFWLGNLHFHYTNPEEDILDIFRYDDLINSLTIQDIRTAAQKYLNDRYVQITLLPAALKPE